jgi:hypothetical protein
MGQTIEVHTARHQLPISNGWSGWGDNLCVRCGRCGDRLFRPDSEWVERYYAAQLRRVEASHASGYLSDGQRLDSVNSIESDAALVRGWLQRSAAS